MGLLATSEFVRRQDGPSTTTRRCWSMHCWVDEKATAGLAKARRAHYTAVFDVDLDHSGVAAHLHGAAHIAEGHAIFVAVAAHQAIAACRETTDFRCLAASTLRASLEEAFLRQGGDGHDQVAEADLVCSQLLTAECGRSVRSTVQELGVARARFAAGSSVEPKGRWTGGGTSRKRVRPMARFSRPGWSCRNSACRRASGRSRAGPLRHLVREHGYQRTTRPWPAVCGGAVPKFLHLVCQREQESREECRVRTGLKLSGLPGGKTLDTFDFAFQHSVDKSQIDPLATSEFVHRYGSGAAAGAPGGWASPTWRQGWASRRCKTAFSVAFMSADATRPPTVRGRTGAST